jgi:hypothetical protein
MMGYPLRHVGCWFGLACLALAAGPVIAADELTARLSLCRGIADVTLRATCYDRFTDSLTARTAPAPQAAASAAAPSTAARTAPPRVAARAPAPGFGADSLPREQREAEEEEGEMSATVAEVTRDPRGFALITLDNGQVWRQTEGLPSRVKQSSAVTIKPGLLGSYFLVSDSPRESYRVRRMQ